MSGQQSGGSVDGVPWWEAEPSRADRDRAEVGALFPTLQWIDSPAGGWHGALPLWPFDRPRPSGIAAVGPGLTLELVYSQAYPVVPPALYPWEPKPEIGEFADHRFHLNGDGSLCLLQSPAQWNGRESVVELLLKAVGWRLEYALVRSGLLTEMTTCGIVADPCLDGLFAEFTASTSSEAST